MTTGQGLRIAVDIGGTFTDICILNETTKELRVFKTASTPDPIDGVMKGVADARIDLSEVTLFSHGTTVATNALITRRLPPTAMVCTAGFRDVLEIRRANKEDLWDAYKDVAPPYIRRRDRLTVPERIDADGNVVLPLDEPAAREVARVLRARGVAAVAVCFINSFINGAHEARMKEILEEELPGVAISTSSEVLPEIFEHERFSTTVVNAILRPVAGDYIGRLSDRLAEGGLKSDLLLLHSGGGVMTAKTAKDFAGRLAGSGIAAGAIASRHIAMLCGYPNSIGVDMGGTSADVSLVWDGVSRVTKDWHIQFGYPIRFPSIEVLTIGAGGGSLAWIDSAGGLHNGPQSAGANPGPCCYGNGNTVPTNTDANVALGRLGTDLAGGEIHLQYDLAATAVKTGVAEPLKMQPNEAAKAILSVANANMADAVRLISITRGYDPRDFALVAFGGAGALHGAALAKELSIPTVIVPPNPGVTSALGCLLVDIRHDLAQSYLAPAAKADTAEVEARFAAMEQEARERLGKDGVPPDGMSLTRSIDMMYQGQWRSLSVPVPAPLTSMEDAVAAFHELHQREYNFRRDDAPVGLFRLNLVAVGTTPKADLAEHDAGQSLPQPKSRRPVDFDETEQPVDTPVYWRSDLPAGVAIEGPAIVDQLDSTTVIPPGVTATVDKWLNLILKISEA
ncbi:MAG TPA: hydantoinase/oxoprolinase family protein [Geminicoccus sp.]|uniref:hydantoinase/oxoprolinase family protein n=1 Tax=Geminicoccus sp. TaxID=2024832 RepID=UPI002E3189F6|nr:hydantoinase/oxoprolinase family protein [Geminicoccus sp.]HEX2528218.1 hydantoinase/oxoprolinase family protein [Geminicoccus sp.]